MKGQADVFSPLGILPLDTALTALPMRNISLNTPFDGKVDELQLLTDSSGWVLNQSGSLYYFQDEAVTPVATPQELQVVDFHFLNREEGIVLGLPKQAEQEGALSSGGGALILAILLLLMALGRFHRNMQSSTRIWLAIIPCSLSLIACNDDWKQHVEKDSVSPFVTHISRLPMAIGSHYFGGNQAEDMYFALTEDGGKTWATYEATTNFPWTDVTAIGEVFVASNYAAPNHGDGDIWLFGQDTSHPILARNELEDPFHISTYRGISGLKHYPQDSLLIAFGSDKITAFPANEVNSTDGNILIYRTNIQAPFQIVDIPGKVVASALARTETGDFWVVTESAELWHYNQIGWEVVTFPDAIQPVDVEYHPRSGRVYMATKDGKLYSSSEGVSWSQVEMQEQVQSLGIFQEHLVAVSEDGAMIL